MFRKLIAVMIVMLAGSLASSKTVMAQAGQPAT